MESYHPVKLPHPRKVSCWLLWQVLLSCSFYGLVVKSLDPQYVAGGTGTLTPYTGVFFFAVGILVSTPIFNTFAMKHPVEGRVVTMKDYFAGDAKTHLTGMRGRFYMDGWHGD